MKTRGLLAIAALVTISFAPSAEAKKHYKWKNQPAPRFEERETSGRDVPALPPCYDTDRSEIRQNNRDVLNWKDNSKNQFKARALVEGVIVGTLLDRRSHLHLEIDLTPENGSADRSENLEVIYNKEFGTVTKVTPGMKIAACGDYITSREQAGNYPPSPVGAIIHWVHASNDLGRHQNGYLVIDSTLFGFEGDGEGRRPEDNGSR